MESTIYDETRETTPKLAEPNLTATPSSPVTRPFPGDVAQTVRADGSHNSIGWQSLICPSPPKNVEAKLIHQVSGFFICRSLLGGSQRLQISQVISAWNVVLFMTYAG